jgi:CheY-like chemotaxis protein
MVHVLVVDDDLEIRETLRFALEDAGYAVSLAAGGKDALAAVRASADPLVVLLDRVMPHPDGEAVLEAVQSERILADRHAFVLVTASPGRISSELTDVLTSLRAPIVEKPFDVEVLLATVELASARLAASAPYVTFDPPAGHTYF